MHEPGCRPEVRAYAFPEAPRYGNLGQRSQLEALNCFIKFAHPSRIHLTCLFSDVRLFSQHSDEKDNAHPLARLKRLEE